jgi:ubiquinone biosynthesis protein
MLTSLKHILHLTKICKEFAKNDALFFVTSDFPKPLYFAARFFKLFASKQNQNIANGEKLLNTFQNLGPTFIKLGQFLSIRPDIVGDEIAETLTKLQDRLAPFPFADVEKTFIEEFGVKPSELFTSFDEIPVAAASISQVHFAVDKNGNELAVKVLRPDVEAKFAKDLAAVLFLAEFVDENIPSLKRLNMVKSVKLFKQICASEMDLLFEAAAASEFKENLKNDVGVYVPAVYWRLTSQKILTLERISGLRVDDVPALLANNIQPDTILKNSADLFLNQALRDGFFHADMHPGNVYINPQNGQIIIFDFGIMGRIDYKTRIFLAEMLLGFIRRDYKKIADIHFDIGFIPKNQNRELFAQACRAIGEPIFGLPQNEISIANLLKQLLRVAATFEMEVQTQMILLQKTMMMAEGIGRKLNPNINFWELSEGLIEAWALQNLGPKGKAKRLFSDAKEFLMKVKHTHENLDNIITDEGLKMHPEFIAEVKKANAKNQNNFWKGLILGVIVASMYWYITK